MRRRNAAWKDERVERLKDLWANNWSASMIGDELGASRNAVLGKLHRLGLLSPRAKSECNARPSKPKIERRGAPKRLFPPASAVPLVEAAPSGVATATLLDLRAGVCRWPVGDPHDEAFGYCGVGAAVGRPYCNAHMRIAYEPGPRRKWRSRSGMEKGAA